MLNIVCTGVPAVDVTFQPRIPFAGIVDDVNVVVVLAEVVQGKEATISVACVVLAKVLAR